MTRHVLIIQSLAAVLLGLLLFGGCATLCEQYPDLPWCGDGPELPARYRVMWLRDYGAAWRAEQREMNLSGEAVSMDQYKAEIHGLLNAGMNTHLVFTYNLKDGTAFGGKTDIYHNGFASEVDEAKLSALLEKLDYAAQHMTLCLCPMPDDGGFDYDNMSAVRRHYEVFVERIVNRYADNRKLAPYGVKIMFALEPEEYWNQSQFNEIGAYLRTLTDVEINCHGTKGHYQWAHQAAWCDVINLQLDYRHDPGEIVHEAETVMHATTKPLYVWEVTRGGADDSHRLNVRAGLEALDPEAKRIKGTP